jgi:hypothetical protein
LVTLDKHFPELAAALSQGFAIQAFFIPILKKNPNIDKHKKILLITYVVGAAIYMFIGYGGALSIKYLICRYYQSYISRSYQT